MEPLFATQLTTDYAFHNYNVYDVYQIKYTNIPNICFLWRHNDMRSHKQQQQQQNVVSCTKVYGKLDIG